MSRYDIATAVKADYGRCPAGLPGLRFWGSQAAVRVCAHGHCGYNRFVQICKYRFTVASTLPIMSKVPPHGRRRVHLYSRPGALLPMWVV